MSTNCLPVRTALRLLWCTALVAAVALPAAAPAQGADDSVPLAPGVTYRVVEVATPRGTARAHVVEVDLTEPAVTVDLLYPGAVAQAAPLAAMAQAQGAVAAVNGDFFNISVTQPGVTPTNAPVGPAVASGIHLKAAVPTRQRFGPSLPAGATVEDVIGVGEDGIARLGRLTLEGRIITPYGTYPVSGLNQYAIAQGGIGVFNEHWGAADRGRAVCGSDNRRDDPCSKDVFEVTVTAGRVVATSAQPGRGPVGADSVVLLGREAGAQALRQLQANDPVTVEYRLVSSQAVPFRFAVGGHPIVRDGHAVAGLDNATAAVRSAAGIRDGGHTLILLALERSAAGMTYAELAQLLLSLGAHDGVNLDGGGSSTLAVREPGAAVVTVKNLASGEAQRAVPNGIGVFVKE